jgi:hypothetical protein
LIEELQTLRFPAVAAGNAGTFRLRWDSVAVIGVGWLGRRPIAERANAPGADAITDTAANPTTAVAMHQRDNFERSALCTLVPPWLKRGLL